MVQLTIIAYSFQKISKREKKWTQFFMAMPEEVILWK